MKQSAIVVASAFALTVVAAAQRATAKVTAPTSRPVTVTGLLLDDHYQPAVDVPIGFSHGVLLDTVAAMAKPVATSGSDGTFRVVVQWLASGWNFLLIGGKGFAVQGRHLHEAGDTIELGTITLARGWTAVGRVRSADGASMTGVWVQCTDLLSTRDYLRLARQSMLGRAGVVVDDGVFHLPGALRTAARIDVYCAGYYDESVFPVAMGTPLDITLQRARIVNGRALDANGEPLADVEVSAGPARTKTAADGTFSLPLRSRAPSALHAHIKLAGVADLQVPVPSDDAAIELRFAAAVADGAEPFRVRAVDVDGRPLQEFAAWLAWTNGKTLGTATATRLLVEAARNPQQGAVTTTGELALPGPDRAAKKLGVLFVRAEGYAWGEVQLQANSSAHEQVVTLLPDLIVEGQLIDMAGQPIAGAQIVPTRAVTDPVQVFVQRKQLPDGWTSSPDTVTTDAHGHFRLVGLPTQELDLFVYCRGQLLGDAHRLDLTSAKAPEPLRIQRPTPATLRGVTTGVLRSGLAIRLHRHQEGIDSASWLNEYEGAQLLANDGAFVFGNVGPTHYRPEILLPSTPRHGVRPKLYLPLWNGANPPADDYQCKLPETTLVTGTVGGEVPWHRLGVISMPSEHMAFAADFTPTGPLALLEPDRSFRMLVPHANTVLVLLDVVTGIALEHRSFAADALAKPITWSGSALAATLHLTSDDDHAGLSCRVDYEPEPEHWPCHDPRFRRVTALGRRNSMASDWQFGQHVQLWLPTKTGTLRVLASGPSSNQQDTDQPLDISRLRGDDITATLGEHKVELRETKR